MENVGRLSLNTSELEHKIAAFNHILKVASAMGTSFEPHIKSVFPILQSHMTYTSRTLRKFAMKTFQHLLRAQGEPANLTLFSSTYDLFALCILKANKNQDAKELKLLFKELFHCMRVISENEQPENRLPFQAADKLRTFGMVMKGCLDTVAAKKQEQMAVIEEKHQNKQIDEEDMEEVQEKLGKITGAATYIGECTSILMEVYKKDVVGVVDSSVKNYFA